MKAYIDSLLNEVINYQLNKIRKERLSISERIALETSLTRLRIVRQLIERFL